MRASSFILVALLGGAAFGACVGDDPSGSGSIDAGTSSGAPPITSGAGEQPSPSSSSGSSSGSAASDASASDASETVVEDPRCAVQVPLAASSASSTCKAIIFASTPIGLIPGRFDLADVNEGAISSSCVPSTDVWRGTLDLVTDGPDWAVHLAVEVNGVRTEYKFTATITGATSERTIVGTPICGSPVPLLDEADAAVGSRSSRINFNQNESGVRTLEIFVRHPVTSEYRRLQFKPR